MSDNGRQQTLEALARAARIADSKSVESSLVEAFRIGFTPEFVPVLIELLEMPWHNRHEDIVSSLQQLKDPRAVDPLYRAAIVTHAYLDYDEFFGLARKCTWALADIGTAEAQARLKSLALNEKRADRSIRSEASR